MSRWDLESSRKLPDRHWQRTDPPPNCTLGLPGDIGFHGAGKPIPAAGQHSSVRGRLRPSQAAACRGGAREREGDGASSVTMAWYSQSSRKLFLAKRTHIRRADRTMCAAVRIT